MTLEEKKPWKTESDSLICSDLKAVTSLPVENQTRIDQGITWHN